MNLAGELSQGNEWLACVCVCVGGLCGWPVWVACVSGLCVRPFWWGGKWETFLSLKLELTVLLILRYEPTLARGSKLVR